MPFLCYFEVIVEVFLGFGGMTEEARALSTFLTADNRALSSACYKAGETRTCQRRSVAPKPLE